MCGGLGGGLGRRRGICASECWVVVGYLWGGVRARHPIPPHRAPPRPAPPRPIPPHPFTAALWLGLLLQRGGRLPGPPSRWCRRLPARQCIGRWVMQTLPAKQVGAWLMGGVGTGPANAGIRMHVAGRACKACNRPRASADRHTHSCMHAGVCLAGCIRVRVVSAEHLQTCLKSNLIFNSHLNAHPAVVAMTLETVDKALDEVRPYLIADGGNVEVRAQGAGCMCWSYFYLRVCVWRGRGGGGGGKKI